MRKVRPNPAIERQASHNNHRRAPPMQLIDTARVWARRVKRDAVTLWFAGKHPGTPWYAKALGAFVVAYALSPIDLIPDFIPVLGYLDDVILLPVLIWLTVRLLPPEVLVDSRGKAEVWMATSASRPRSFVGAVAIVAIWLVVGSVLAFWVVNALAIQVSQHTLWHQ